MQEHLHGKNEKLYGVIFLATVISCFIGFYNNFPLVFPDTGTYIHSGFEHIVFMDRPIFYGWFVRYISMGISPWYIVFVQGLLLCYLLYLTVGVFFQGFQRKLIYLALVTFLSLTTGLSFTVSILIPDVFSSIAILCVINLLLNKKLKIFEIILISIIFMFSICTQLSTIPVLMGLLFLVLCHYLIKKLRKKEILISFRRIFLCSTLFLSTLFVIPASHYAMDKQFKISGVNHLFIMNHLLEVGVLRDYLNKNCDSHNYKICPFKDYLTFDFIWAQDGVIEKTGGLEANRLEYKAIVKDIMSRPEYFWLVVGKSIEYTFKQFFTFNISVSPPQLKYSAPYGQVEWRFPDTIMEYISSLQNRGELYLSGFNATQMFVVLFSMVFIFIVLLSPYFKRKLDPLLVAALVLTVIHNLISAFMCSNLSTVHPRFQNRIIWLFPFFTIIIVIKLIQHRRKEQASQVTEQS